MDKIFIIGNCEHAEFLEEKEFEIQASPPNDKVLETIQNFSPDVLILDNSCLEEEFCDTFFNEISSHQNFQRIVIIVIAQNEKDWRKQFVNTIDDLLFAPKQSEILEKLQNWCNIKSEYIVLSNWHKRVPILEQIIEKVRILLREGNLGYAKSILQKVSVLFATFSDKSIEQERLSSIIEMIEEFTEKTLHLPIISQLNAISLSSHQKILDEIEQASEKKVTEKAREELTRPMELEQFIKRKKEFLAAVPVAEEQAPEENPTSTEDVKKDETMSAIPVHEESSEFQLEIKIRSSEAEFARKLLQRKMISKQQLRTALEEQKRVEEKHRKLVPLCNIMLTDKMVLPEDIQRVFGQQAITTFFCKQCDKMHRVLNLSLLPPESFSCRTCKSPLSYPPEDDGLFIMPDMEAEETANLPVVSDAEIPVDVNEGTIPILLEKATVLAKKKDIDRALAIYDQILEVLPDNEVCRVGRSRIFVENKAYDKAVEEANLVLQKNPDNYQAVCHRGVAKYYLNDLDAAMADLSLLIDKRVHNFMSHSTRGKLYFRLKDYKKAIEDLTRSLMLAPDFVKGYIYRGKAYMHLGKNRLAIHDFEEALKINPDYPNFKEVQKLIDFAKERSKNFIKKNI